MGENVVYWTKERIIFWVVVAVLLILLGFWLKYTRLDVTIVTILVGLGGIVVGWIARVLYGKYITK